MRVRLDSVAAKGCAVLADAPWMSVARRLKLRGEVGDPGIQSIARSGPLAGLTALNMGDCQIGSTGAAALASGRLAGLTTLSLSGNPIRDKGVAALVAGTWLSKCRRVFLARCGVTDKGAALLAQATQLSSLTGLCLGNNAVGDSGAKALMESPHLRALKRLELDQNELSAKVVSALEKRFGRALRLGYGRGGGDDGEGDDDG
jgi:hypothetical protein